VKFLVLAAFDPELVRFRELVMDEIACDAVGVGLVDAAAGVTRCILRHRPTHVLLIGTCGGLRIATGEVVCGSRARLVAPKGEELPPPLVSDQDFDAELTATLVSAGAKCVQIANTVGVTTDDVAAARLAEEHDVEHLEAFAFARACASLGVAAGVVLGVANAVGSAGRAEWRANHVAASARAADVAWRAIKTSTTKR
jgi:nucleoside phosphorylase